MNKNTTYTQIEALKVITGIAATAMAMVAWVVARRAMPTSTPEVIVYWVNDRQYTITSVVVDNGFVHTSFFT
tara:strand:- start:705 stop:920 length:216 start_codon:yes stop_codon:yes gene_type:complete